MDGVQRCRWVPQTLQFGYVLEFVDPKGRLGNLGTRRGDIVHLETSCYARIRAPTSFTLVVKPYLKL
jgi:hypothetical protein